MKIPNITVTLKCLFCGAALQGPEDAEYSSGDLIKCADCGEGNDYNSLLDVAKEQGGEQLKNEVEKQLEREFRELFKRR